MKKLIFVCGASGIGKSSACARLYKQLDGSAFVDSDHCRMMNPFSFSDEQRRIVEDNMATMLINYLQCSTIHNVIFLYGFHGPRKRIFDRIMTRISDMGISFLFIPIILECDIEENISRARKDGRDEDRIRFGVENSRKIYDSYDYARLDITHLTVDETVGRLIDIINGCV